jgi:hypothetical protein
MSPSNVALAPPSEELVAEPDGGVSPVLKLVSSPLMGSSDPSAVAEARFASGRAVSLASDGIDRLTVRGPEGVVELSVRFTAEGPVLAFSAASIALATRGDMSLNCETLRVRARGGIVMDAAGDLEQRIGGRQVVDVAGSAAIEAQDVSIRARLGDVGVTANDDVRIDGERVLLNS